MGIEKFFNSIKKSYGDKIISKIEPKTYYSSKFFLLDFNSIIHNISQSVSNSLCYLYHISLVANIKSDIYQTNHKQIQSNINNLITDFILESNINIPEQQSSDQQTYYNTQIDFSKLTIDNLDRAFFNIIMTNDNLDKLIIHIVSSYVRSLIDYMPNLQLLYMAIDGVPLYSKMIEQKKRRTITYILEESKSKVLEHYKTELDIDPNINNKDVDIYYNHYEFELKIRRLKFNKNKISPATKFMSDLEIYIQNYLNNKIDQKIKIILDSFKNMGEGEKKIVYKIHELSTTRQLLETDLITVYSPDADVILLMLMELDKAQIQIMRYDQQQNQLDMININELRMIIIEYMRYQNKPQNIQHKIILDIIMLFTLLGNDFLPKIENINTNRHIKNIFDSYIRLNINDRFIFDLDIDWCKLRDFFINLNKTINPIKNEFYRRSKNWSLLPDQVLNQNAISYYMHIFNIDNLSNTYEPGSATIIDYSNILIERISRKYLQGIIWLRKYYLEHNFNYKLFYYRYDIAPTLKQLIKTINQIINNNKLLEKILLNLEKTIPKQYFTPQTQLIYITSIDVLDIIDDKYLTEQFKSKIITYNDKYNKELNINIINDRINIFDYLDCTNAIFLSKCNIKKTIKINPQQIINYFYN